MRGAPRTSIAAVFLAVLVTVGGGAKTARGAEEPSDAALADGVDRTDGASAAGPSADELAFRAATQLSAAGQAPEAARALEELLARLPPGDEVADDALFELARLREESLGDLPGAQAAYRRLMTEHPGARLARRAEARAQVLATTLGPGGQHAATAEAITRATRRPPGESLAAAEELARLLDAAPDYPGTAEAARWAAGAFRRADRFPDARRWFTRARDAARAAGDREGEREARRGLAELALTLGDWEEARVGYLGLVDGAAEGDRVGLEAALGRVALLSARHARARWAWVVLAFVLAAAALALRHATGAWSRAPRALWPPPTEVWYLGPPALLLGGMALAGNVLIARAVVTVLAAGLGIAWLSGAILDAARRTRGRTSLGRAAAHAVVALVAVAAVCLLAFSRDALLDLIAATFRHGAER